VKCQRGGARMSKAMYGSADAVIWGPIAMGGG